MTTSPETRAIEAADLAFHFETGRLCLNFTATLAERHGASYDRWQSPADLARSMGVLGSDPSVEEALQTVLRACLAANVACGKTMGPDEMPRRLEEGWKMINLGSASGGLTADNDAALRAMTSR